MLSGDTGLLLRLQTEVLEAVACGEPLVAVADLLCRRAEALAPEVVELALRRYQFNAKPVTDAILAEQQKLADTFFELKLIPKRIEVRQASVLATR